MYVRIAFDIKAHFITLFSEGKCKSSYRKLIHSWIFNKTLAYALVSICLLDPSPFFYSSYDINLQSFTRKTKIIFLNLQWHRDLEQENVLLLTEDILVSSTI